MFCLFNFFKYLLFEASVQKAAERESTLMERLRKKGRDKLKRKLSPNKSLFNCIFYVKEISDI